MQKTHKKLRRLHGKLSRQDNGSSNSEKTRKKIAKLHFRIANIRWDGLHKATSGIVAKTKPNAQRPSMVVLEDMNVNGMTLLKKPGFSVIMLDSTPLWAHKSTNFGKHPLKFLVFGLDSPTTRIWNHLFSVEPWDAQESQISAGHRRCGNAGGWAAIGLQDSLVWLVDYIGIPVVSVEQEV